MPSRGPTEEVKGSVVQLFDWVARETVAGLARASMLVLETAIAMAIASAAATEIAAEAVA